MTLGSNENIEYNILIDGIKAIEQLRELTAHAESFKQKIAMVGAQVRASSREWGMSIANTKSVFKELDRIMSESGEDSVLFGKMHKQGWDEAGKAADQGSSKVAKGIDVVRTAMGVLVSMLIFQVLQAIQNVFSTLIHNIRESELAIYNLINAERKLSQEGIDITPKGLQEMIDGVRELVPIISEIQAEELVSRVASNVAPSIKLTRDEMDKLNKSVALAYVQNKALGYSFDEVEKSMTESILTGKVSQGINKYGVKIDDLIVKQHAVSIGLVESADAFDKLDAQMQAHVKAVAFIDYAYQEFSRNAESIPAYMETADAAIERTNTAWNDFLTTLGSEFGPIIAQGFGALADSLENLNEWFEKNKDGMAVIIDFMALLIERARATKDASDQLKGTRIDQFFGNFANNIVRAVPGFGPLINNITSFKTAMEATSAQVANDPNLRKFLSLFGIELSDAIDTSTGAIENFQDQVNKFDASGFAQEIDDILTDAERASQDIDEKLQDKQEDIDLEYDRKRLDAERDYYRKVEDINRDAEREIANLKDEQREEDLRAEQDYQNKLWELRMRYLLNLEDALHARDARQVIRLMKEYEIDKEALERKKNLDDQQREEDQRDALEDIEIKRQQRLEDARIEYQQKLEDLNVAKQRELDDLAVWYDRELADLQLATQRKLETLIAGWVEEQKITEANAAQVYGILYKYFGPGGMTDALYQYMMNSMLQAQASAMSMGAGMIGGRSPVSAPGTTGSTEGDTGHKRGGLQMAEGGSLLATRSTKVEFGEAGPELATFVPLNKIGRDVGKLFGLGGGGASRRDGKLLIELLLSPDLEARVVDKAMDGVGDVIARVNRTKV